MNEEVLGILENLKKQKCQWLYRDTSVVFNFEAEIKDVFEDPFTGGITINFKGPRISNQHMQLKDFFTCESEEDEKKVRHRFYSEDKKSWLTCGYIKAQQET